MDHQSRGYLTHTELQEFKQTIQVISRAAKGYRQIVTFDDINMSPNLNITMSPLQDVSDFFRSAAAKAVNIYTSPNKSSAAATATTTADVDVYREQPSMYNADTLDNIV